MRRLVVATGNPGKLAEFRDLLADSGLELASQRELGIEDPPETGTTFVENAIIKARHAAQASGLPALADDSGLIVDALDGAPGLISAHYGGVHGDAARNIARLLDDLRDVPDERRSARFHSVIVLLRHAADPAPADRRRHLGRLDPAGPARQRRLRLRPGVLQSRARLRGSRIAGASEEPRQPPWPRDGGAARPLAALNLAPTSAQPPPAMCSRYAT